MDIHHLLYFIVAGLLLNLTPGPDVLYIVTHALRSGARAGMVAALGITTGCFVHIFAAAVGVSALMAASATAFTVLKWAGAAYLVYVGLRMLLARAPAAGEPSAMSLVASDQNSEQATALKRIFFQGFWTNVLNPKVALFFLAFVPQFITPDMQNKPLAFLLLGLLFNFNGLWVGAGWALAAAWMAKRIGAVQRGMHWLERVAGAMFVGFGIKLALSDNPAS
ncbi:Threonine/homoserine/homoserine lactone efflux protein [Polaromonas sp. YR568]|uniref:LysE family translocator n=1 Tax=Polaromonas sp. YR568 TaxID=1855301 RepID=UPI0008DF0B98|nr:LysE family translocator [Polaromonas sp. YR568]SFV00344.1 Threonine/homoserine/homoserine lactone efflux protein [Polaromonas sp. YR568]